MTKTFKIDARLSLARGTSLLFCIPPKCRSLFLRDRSGAGIGMTSVVESNWNELDLGKLRVRSSTSDRFIDEHDTSESNLTCMQNASHRQTLSVGMLSQARTRTVE